MCNCNKGGKRVSLCCTRAVFRFKGWKTGKVRYVKGKDNQWGSGAGGSLFGPERRQGAAKVLPVGL